VGALPIAEETPNTLQRHLLCDGLVYTGQFLQQAFQEEISAVKIESVQTAIPLL
jgi:hypothetical protein